MLKKPQHLIDKEKEADLLLLKQQQQQNNKILNIANINNNNKNGKEEKKEKEKEEDSSSSGDEGDDNNNNVNIVSSPSSPSKREFITRTFKLYDDKKKEWIDHTIATDKRDYIRIFSSAKKLELRKNLCFFISCAVIWLSCIWLFSEAMSYFEHMALMWIALFFMITMVIILLVFVKWNDDVNTRLNQMVYDNHKAAVSLKNVEDSHEV